MQKPKIFMSNVQVHNLAARYLKFVAHIFKGNLMLFEIYKVIMIINHVDKLIIRLWCSLKIFICTAYIQSRM